MHTDVKFVNNKKTDSPLSQVNIVDKQLRKSPLYIDHLVIIKVVCELFISIFQYFN